MSFRRPALESFCVFQVPTPSKSKTVCVLTRISVFLTSAGHRNRDSESRPSATSTPPLSAVPTGRVLAPVKPGGGGAGPGFPARLPHQAGAVASSYPPPCSGTGFVTAGSFLPGSGARLPLRLERGGQPRTLISAESDTRRAESVDIYYCSQESGARGGGGWAETGREGGRRVWACGRPWCVFV